MVVGPGPGDPNSETCPKMMAIRKVIKELLRTKTRFLAVCLGHQFTTRELGFKVLRIFFKILVMRANFSEIGPSMGVQPSQDFFQNFEVDMDQNFRNSLKLALITKILKKILKTLNPSSRVVNWWPRQTARNRVFVRKSSLMTFRMAIIFGQVSELGSPGPGQPPPKYPCPGN